MPMPVVSRSGASARASSSVPLRRSSSSRQGRRAATEGRRQCWQTASPTPRRWPRPAPSRPSATRRNALRPEPHGQRAEGPRRRRHDRARPVGGAIPDSSRRGERGSGLRDYVRLPRSAAERGRRRRVRKQAHPRGWPSTSARTGGATRSARSSCRRPSSMAARGVGIYPGGALHFDLRETPAIWGPQGIPAPGRDVPGVGAAASRVPRRRKGPRGLDAGAASAPRPLPGGDSAQDAPRPAQIAQNPRPKPRSRPDGRHSGDGDGHLRPANGPKSVPDAESAGNAAENPLPEPLLRRPFDLSAVLANLSAPLTAPRLPIG